MKKVEFIIPDVVQGGTYSNSSFSFAIWEKAFEGCQNLETVIFPETTTVVYEGKIIMFAGIFPVEHFRLPVFPNLLCLQI